VIELEGHGLSEGPRAVCGDFDRSAPSWPRGPARAAPTAARRLVHQTVAVVAHIRAAHAGRWALCGSSLGAAVCAYVAESIDDAADFVGLVLLAPAVGVEARVLPGLAVRSALRFLSAVAPAAVLPLTPSEDPTRYNYPPGSTRNYSGHWPLATSRMLLDLTSGQVEEDQAASRLLLRRPLLVVSGTKDHIVPFQQVEAFFGRATAADKELLRVPGAGHDLTVNGKYAHRVVDKIFAFLQARV